jgi:hypothetical protein
MNNFEASYKKILEYLKSITEKESFLKQIRKPRLTAIEIISINLTAEYMGLDSECQLFRKMPDSLTSKIERSVYNKRKRKLFFAMSELREKISEKFNEFEQYFVVDSMPLEVAKLSRSSRSKICRAIYETAPDKGYCASQQSTYYGYKLHAVCSVSGVIKSLDISKASVHDINYLRDIKEQFSNCVIMGDRGYISAEYQYNLFETKQIKLEVPMRTNQHNYKKQPYVFRKSRKRIETIFSQLCDQFMIRRNYAKSFDGFKTRIISKITALTVIQAINRFIIGRNLNNIKCKIA